jgi:thiamine pyrophosphokinase
MPRAILFANGRMPDLQVARQILQEDDFVIAADGGARHALTLGRSPQVLIGDMDSIPPAVRESLAKSGTRIVAHPKDKDASDLELAIEFAITEGFREILVIGALGGRTDHAMANLALLGMAMGGEASIFFDDGVEAVWMVVGQTEIRGSIGDIVSLFPWSDPVRGVSTRGLQYPLHEETLLPHRSRGVSNRMTSQMAEINIKEGKLLCFHIRRS